jgi:hypothetical protein
VPAPARECIPGLNDGSRLQPTESEDRDGGEQVPGADEDFKAALRRLDETTDRADRERIVLDLYRDRQISSGKGAALLGMPRVDFIQWTSRLGIPYFRMSEEELKREFEMAAQLAASFRREQEDR